VKLELGNLETKVLKAKKKEIRALSRSMSFFVPKHEFMPTFRAGLWNGKKRFYNKHTKKFLSGLLPFVLKLADKEGFKVKVRDHRKHIEIKKKNRRAALRLLRKYQKKAIRPMLNLTLNDLPWIRGILKHPTGSGKTYVIASLIRAIDRRSIVIVDGRDLLHQTRADLKKLLKRPIGIIGDSKYKLEEITVATIQTLKSRYYNEGLREFLGTIKVCIVDECHRVDQGKRQRGGTFHKVLLLCPAYFRFALSGTPLMRKDLGDVTLIAQTGEIVSRIKRKMLEKKGWLARTRVFVVEIDHPKMTKKVKYPVAYMRGIVLNEERNSIIVDEAVKSWKQGHHTLILVKRRRHGRMLYRRVKTHREHPTCVYLHGGSHVFRRRSIIRQINRSESPIIVVATTIFDQGVNIPELKTIVLAGGGASRIKSIQRVGRGSRKKSRGKNRLRVIDFRDNIHHHLVQHSDERVVAYEQEGLEVVHV